VKYRGRHEQIVVIPSASMLGLSLGDLLAGDPRCLSAPGLVLVRCRSHADAAA
jgi:hypothetical protein